MYKVSMQQVVIYWNFQYSENWIMANLLYLDIVIWKNPNKNKIYSVLKYVACCFSLSLFVKFLITD